MITNAQAVKKAMPRGTLLGVVIAAHLLLALLVLVPAAPRRITAGRRRVNRSAVLRITLLRPPPPPLAPPRVVRPRHRQTVAAARRQPRTLQPQRHVTSPATLAETRKRILHIMGELLASPRGLVHLPHASQGPKTLDRALRARIGRLANGQLAIQIPGLPGAPCFALPQHFPNPNNHGLHLLARTIAVLITPPQMLPYVLKVTSVPDPQPIACHPSASKVNHVFNLPAASLFTPAPQHAQPAADAPHARVGVPSPAESAGRAPLPGGKADQPMVRPGQRRAR